MARPENLVRGGAAAGGKKTAMGGKSVRNGLKRIVALIALVGVAGCGAAAPSSPAPKEGPATADVSGVWAGTIRVTPCDMLGSNGRCNAVNNITFTLNQDGSQLNGKYSCALGNMICRHGGADDSGNINAGSISGNQLNLSVMVPADVSNCYYNGSTTSSNQANGVYMCYQGGLLVEQGVWSVERRSEL
jgi:hypothetical protein